MRPIIILCALTLASPIRAQSTGSIVGSVTDSATGQPVLRTWIMVASQRYARGDSLGRFTVDSVTPGRHQMSVSCKGSTQIGGHQIWQDVVVVVSGQRATRDFKVDARNCDQRPLLAVTGEFRGFYESGFEHSRFVPCPGLVSGLPPSLASLLDPNVLVWAGFSAGRSPRSWPDGEDVRGFRRWYIHWRGTIRGPDSYGHMGVAAWSAAFDTALVLRRPAAGDCRG